MKATSYDVGTTGGNKAEDVRGDLQYLAPEEFPFTSMCRVGDAPQALLVEKGADSYDTPNIAGTREGDDVNVGGDKTTNRVRFGVYPQRWARSYAVSDVQLLLSQKGGNWWTSDEMTWAKVKALKELKRDQEATLLSHQECQAPTSGVMRTRGAFKWLDDASGLSPALPSSVGTPAAQRLTGVANIIETGTNSLFSVLQSLFDQNGVSESYQAFTGSSYLSDLAMFTRTQGETTAVRYNINDTNNGTVTLDVSVFKTTFGTIEFIPSSFLRYSSNVADTDAMLIARTKFWELFYLENPSVYPNPKTAGGASAVIKGIGGLHCSMPRGNAYIYNS